MLFNVGELIVNICSSVNLTADCRTFRPLHTKQFCMQLMKGFVAEMSCNQFVI